MKSKSYIYITTILTILLGYQSTSYNSSFVAGGTVTYQVSTVSYDGKYADKNIGAIWVENSQSQFVKTLKVWAKKRIKDLIKWKAVSGQNVVDAITSATIRTHETHNVTWDCTDINGTIVPDGTYKIVIEFAEHDAAKSGAQPGKWTSVEFVKASAPQTITPTDETYFKNMKLVYSSTNTNPITSISGTVKDAANSSSLENAVVQLKSGNNVQYETNTNISGLYSFNDIQAGSYTLVCFKSGYETSTTNITVNPGDQITGKDISLSRSTDNTSPSPPANVRVIVQN